MKSATLRLSKVMRRMGAHLPERLSSEALREAQLAASRCESCPSQSLCDEDLRAGRSDRFRLFCPNAPYIECLRWVSLDFT
jgi:hypothetical protein